MTATPTQLAARLPSFLSTRLFTVVHRDVSAMLLFLTERCVDARSRAPIGSCNCPPGQAAEMVMYDRRNPSPSSISLLVDDMELAPWRNGPHLKANEPSSKKKKRLTTRRKAQVFTSELLGGSHSSDVVTIPVGDLRCLVPHSLRSRTSYKRHAAAARMSKLASGTPRAYSKLVCFVHAFNVSADSFSSV